MRRSDREIKNWDDIVDVLRRADTIRLGINGDPFPYVVPLSFGFEEKDSQIVLYIHGAKEGFKHNLLEVDNRVCIEADIFHRYTNTGTGLTTEYESVIGFGIAEIITGEEAAWGMDLICTHCGFDGYVYDMRMLEATRVYRIKLSSITGKHNQLYKI